ncbi:arginine--tRNA ligase [Ureaplasma canigenitalium]|uniref:arginine--tRNA ligase n=1 Tax=Ureaplasma canigenitalium TaxID=42092 RepID=UPI0004E1DBEE|nr:arginine--tRNA ligase [Ureaplasma canigenitalium]
MLTEIIKEQIKKVVVDLYGYCPSFIVDKAKNIDYGDFYSNIAFILTKELKIKPFEIASSIKEQLLPHFKQIEVQGAGFLNFYLHSSTYASLMNEVNELNQNYGQFSKTNKTIVLEYVSANPTGHLHIAHAANAIYGDTIKNLLQLNGHTVITEYYVNDAGNQIEKLAYSTLVRYLEKYTSRDVKLIDDAYHGQEIYDVADALYHQVKDQYKDASVSHDGFILDKDVACFVKDFATNYMLTEIKKDLASMNTVIEHYTSEKSLVNEKSVAEILKILAPHTEMKDGALWLLTTKFGDDKDRVLIKTDKTFTYFLPDIIYHNYKQKTYHADQLINIWGTDHLGYIKRMKTAYACLGYKEEDLIVLCAQVMKLTKNNEEFKLSKRSGNSLTIKDLIAIIGKDAMRWFLGSSSMKSHVVIDVDLALRKDSNNPLYYVQYAHARCHQILMKTALELDFSATLLTNKHERSILNHIAYYENTIVNSTQNFEPHLITNYLYDLATMLHTYYQDSKIIDLDNLSLSKQRYTLIKTVKQILSNGLNILKILPYNSMY